MGSKAQGWIVRWISGIHFEVVRYRPDDPTHYTQKIYDSEADAVAAAIRRTEQAREHINHSASRLKRRLLALR